GGNRGGETRSNALWGKGGRGFVTALVAALAVCVPLASSSSSQKPGAKAHRSGVFLVKRTYIAPALEERAGKRPNSTMPAIIQADRPEFAGRVLANVNLSTLTSAPGDERGHGTFVAGVAAGAAKGYAGAVPQANLVAIKVMNADGMAKTSDVITACQWILANK